MIHQARSDASCMVALSSRPHQPQTGGSQMLPGAEEAHLGLVNMRKHFCISFASRVKTPGEMGLKKQ